jgi:hypothetical protein
MTTLLQLAQSYTDPESHGYKLAWQKAYLDDLLGDKDFGDLAFQDQVQLAMLGETVIEGGYLRTELIKANSILAKHLNVDNLSAISGKFSKLMAGATSGAKLEMGERAGEPFLKMFDSAQILRVEMQQDRITLQDEVDRFGGALRSIRYQEGGYDVPTILLEGRESIYVGATPDFDTVTNPNKDPVFAGMWARMVDGPKASLIAIDWRGSTGGYYSYISVKKDIDIKADVGGAVRIGAFMGNIYLEDLPETTSAANARFAPSTGRVLRSTSAAKYKTDVEPIDEDRAEAFFGQCQPSWYRSLCKHDRKDWSWYGYVADDVAKVEPRLVDFNADGEPEGFAYDHVMPLLHVVIKNNRRMIEDMQDRLEVIENKLNSAK